MPRGTLNPVKIVVTVVGFNDTMEAEPPVLAVQLREPAQATPPGPTPNSPAQTVADPPGSVGSIIRSPPGLVVLVTKIFPLAATMLWAFSATQLSTNCPSLTRIFITLSLRKFA